METTGGARTVLIVLPRRVHLLDVAGPVQVFSAAADMGLDYCVRVVADSESVSSHQGITLGASIRWPDLGSDDLVLVPGWKRPAGPVPLDDGTLARIARHHAAGGHVASVCAGAFALAQAGVLDGLEVTTHHDLIDELGRFPGLSVARDVLYTCSSRVHTSAGIASGIDLSLHLVAHEHGPAAAARIARSLVVPAWRPGTAGQTPVTLAHRDHMADVVHRAQDILDAADGPIPRLADLARELGVSGRTLARRFTDTIGVTPHAYAAAVRREKAERLVDSGWTRESAALAVGYADARSLRGRT